jgi:hypothetical protein
VTRARGLLASLFAVVAAAAVLLLWLTTPQEDSRSLRRDRADHDTHESAPSSTAGLLVRVRDGRTGTSIAGAVVTLRRHESATIVASLRTTALGIAVAPSIDLGDESLDVTAAAPGFVPQQQVVLLSGPHDRSQMVTLDLQGLGVVRGRVVADDLTSIGAASLYLSLDGVFKAPLQSRTDTSGHFVISDLPPTATGQLRVESPGYLPEVMQVTAGPADTSFVTVTLKPVQHGSTCAVVVLGSHVESIAPQLRATLSAAGVVVSTAGLRWDASTGVARAFLRNDVGAAPAAEVKLLNVFGDVVGARAWTPGTPGITFQLDGPPHYLQVTLPPGAARPTTALEWSTARARGSWQLDEGPPDRVVIFLGPQPATTTVSLEWGCYRGAAVLPTDHLARLEQTQNGRVILTNAPASVGTISFARDGAATGKVDARFDDQGCAAASLAPGTYDLLLDGTTRLTTVRVFAESETVVNVLDLLVGGIIVVTLPMEGVPRQPVHVFVNVLEPGGWSVAEERLVSAVPTVTFTGMPPGRYRVEARDAGQFIASAYTSIQADESRSVTLVTWQPTGKYRFVLEDRPGEVARGLAVKVKRLDVPRAMTLSQHTDDSGQFVVLGGAGQRVQISCGTDGWVVALKDPDVVTTLRRAGEDARELRLRFAGWWEGHVAAVALIEDTGGIESRFAQPRAANEFAVRVRGENAILLVVLLNDSRAMPVCLLPPIGGEHTIVDAPQRSRITFAVENPGNVPIHTVHVGLTGWAGIGAEVGDTPLARKLMGVAADGETMFLYYSGPVQFVAIGSDSKGHIRWRSPAFDGDTVGTDATVVLRADD